MKILIFLISLLGYNFCLAKYEDPRPPIYSIAQEQQFESKPELFAYFSELYVYKKSPEQIAKEHELSKEENLAFLNELAKIKLIKPLPELTKLPAKLPAKLPVKIEFLVSGVSRFRENGPLSRKYAELSINEYSEKLKEELRNDNPVNNTSTTGFWITEDQHQALLQELYELDQKYVALSLENRKTGDKKAHRVSMMRALIPNWEPSFFKKIKMDKSQQKQ